jgi:hypothetical protein
MRAAVGKRKSSGHANPPHRIQAHIIAMYACACAGLSDGVAVAAVEQPPRSPGPHEHDDHGNDLLSVSDGHNVTCVPAPSHTAKWVQEPRGLGATPTHACACCWSWLRTPSAEPHSHGASYPKRCGLHCARLHATSTPHAVPHGPGIASSGRTLMRHAPYPTVAMVVTAQ